MDARESVDLTKMAVTAMMVVLVLGALLSLFMFMYTTISKASSDTQQTVSMTTTDKLHDLCNASNSGDYPWVSSVINAITEVDDMNLLYIHVVRQYYEKTADPNSPGVPREEVYYFTYNNVTVTGAPTSQVKKFTNPTDEACKYLLNSTNKRCAVQYLTGDNGIAYNDLVFDCLQITIFRD